MKRSLFRCSALCTMIAAFVACNAISGVDDYAFDKEGQGGSLCLETPCKLVSPQCGCPEGTQCSINASGRFCISEGQLSVGQQCGGSNGFCAPGLLCVGASGVNLCRKMCAADTDCEPPTGICTRNVNDSAGMPLPGVILCSDNCTLTTNAGCSVPGTACQLARESDGMMRVYSFCSGSGTGQQGDLCTSNSDCAPTFICLNNACLSYCNVQQPTCAVGTCTPFNPPAILGSAEYGACL